MIEPSGKILSCPPQSLPPTHINLTHSNWDKVRIISLYIIHREGVPDEDRRRLFQHAQLSANEMDAVNNLVYLGVKVVKSSNDRDNRKRLKFKSSGGEGEYDLSRYKPAVKSMLEVSHLHFI